MGWNPLSLPRELTLAICEELELNELKHMRLTCKTLANVAASLVFSHITIPLKGATTFEEMMSDLQSQRAAVICAKEITFDDSSSIFRHPEEKRIREEFLAALTAFKVVQSVNWHTRENDPLWSQVTIQKAIWLFPNLRHLKISSLFLKQPLGDLESLESLESISIIGNPFKYIGSLSRLYASSSNLKSITIKNLDRIDDEFSLRQLFLSSPKRNPTHGLRRLALSDLVVRFDEVTLSHLTHLTSFELSHRFRRTSPDDIWIAFRRSKIRLEELKVGSSAISDSLGDYLSSFSGLKKLKLTIPSLDQATSGASAVKFWSEGFPNHIDTMQDFSLLAPYGDQWCLGHHNRSLVAECTKLEQLTVSLLPEDIPTNDSDFNGVNALIDTVVTHMPHIKQFDLAVPARAEHRGRSRCGTHRIMDIHRDVSRLMDWVPKYTPPASCQGLTVDCTLSDPRRVTVGIRRSIPYRDQGAIPSFYSTPLNF